MTKSIQIMKTTAVAVLAAVAVTTLGVDHALAQAGADFGTMAKTGILKTQTGGAASIIKQGSVILGAAFGVGGVGKLYGNAKDGFKEGAKGFVVPGIMVAASGLMFGANALTNNIVRKSTGTDTDQAVTNTTGGDVNW